MKRIALLIVNLFLAAPAAAQDSPWDCADPGNLPQQGMNYCAYEDFLEADRILNEVWDEVYPQIQNRDLDLQDDLQGWDEALLAAQRAWLTFRDKHCETEGFMFRGGTMEPFIVASCRADLTKERTKQLLQLVETY